MTSEGIPTHNNKRLNRESHALELELVTRDVMRLSTLDHSHTYSIYCKKKNVQKKKIKGRRTKRTTFLTLEKYFPKKKNMTRRSIFKSNKCQVCYYS